jgi:hypothetical protein
LGLVSAVDLVVMAAELLQDTDMAHFAKNKKPTSFWGGFLFLAKKHPHVD